MRTSFLPPRHGPTDWVTSLAALPLLDGRCLLASGSRDQTIRLWDPQAGMPLHVIAVGLAIWALAYCDNALIVGGEAGLVAFDLSRARCGDAGTRVAVGTEIAPRPPAQIRTCGTTACGSCLES